MTDTTQVNGIGAALARVLAEHGYPDAESIASARPEDLTKVPRIGETSAPGIIAAAKALVSGEAPAPTRRAPRKPAQRPLATPKPLPAAAAPAETPAKAQAAAPAKAEKPAKKDKKAKKKAKAEKAAKADAKAAKKDKAAKVEKKAKKKSGRKGKK